MLAVLTRYHIFMDGRLSEKTATARRSFVWRPHNTLIPNRTSGRQFLIATDDDHVSGIVNEAVKLLGGTAAFVRSASDAITSARSRSSSLVFLDQCLSDAAGLELARSLRRDTPGLPFVLIGTGLTTSITVEAMKLGAFTVLEKPLSVNEIIATIGSAMIEAPPAAPITVHTPPSVPNLPGSISERWALHVWKACEASRDLRTLGAWASFSGVSYSSLCETCRLVGVQPLDARDLTRVLRALIQSHFYHCRIEELLDISDRRTLKILMTRAGLNPDRDRYTMSVEQFLASQRFVPSSNRALAALRALLLR